MLHINVIIYFYNNLGLYFKDLRINYKITGEGVN